jgi:hypothetical protein
MRLTASDLQSMGFNPDGSRIGKGPSGPVATSKVAVREADLHDSILAVCRARGWLPVHSRMDVPQTAGVGTPDFVVALPGARVVWVECKAAKGKLTTEQAAWLAGLRRLGHRAEVVRSLEEFLTVAESVTPTET